MTIKVTKRVYEDIDDFPEIVFKYRTWTSASHQSIINDQIVFMARPTSFEDPLDCKLQKRYDLITDDEIYAKYYTHSKKDNVGWTEEQHKAFAKEWFDKSPMHDKEHIKNLQKNDFERFDERFGVLSLTANPNSNEMWTKYSDNHKGFSVGFNSKEMFLHLGGGGEVLYYDELPNIMPADGHEEEHFKQVFSKERKWEFEKEYRTHLFSPVPLTKDTRKIKLPKSCYRKIIFGADITPVHKQEIIEACKTQSIVVDFYKCIKNDNGEIEIQADT